MLFITRILFYGPSLGFLFSVKLLYTIATTEESRQFSLKCMQCIHNVTSLLYTCCNLPLALLSFSHKLLTLLWKRDGGGGTVVRGIQQSSTAGQKMKCFSPVVSYFFFFLMQWNQQHFTAFLEISAYCFSFTKSSSGGKVALTYPRLQKESG